MNKRYYSYSRIHPFEHKYTIGGTLINAGVDLVGRAVNPDNNRSTAGNILSGASKIAGLIPGIGTAASVVLNAVGEGVDTLWGSNINQAAVDNARTTIAGATKNIGDSLTWDTLADNMQDLSAVDINIGTQGIFSHKVDDEQAKLRHMLDSAVAAANFAKGNIGTLESRKMRGTALADGGPIFKTDYDMGLTFVNNGGTHESNPYGGVFFGIAPDGQPNQVEEGEVVFNDYVYSNRLKVPKAVRSKYKLREQKDLTFAEAMKEYFKKNGVDERNNDPITQRGLEAFASELALNQEMERAQKEMKERQAAFGGPLDTIQRLGLLEDRFNRDNIDLHQFAPGGYILYDRAYRDFDNLYSDESPYMKALNYLNDPANTAMRDALIADINAGKYNNTTDNINGFTVTPENWYKLATDYKKGPVHNALINWANQQHEAAEAKRALDPLPEIGDDNIFNNGVVTTRALKPNDKLEDVNAIWNYAANKGGLYNNAGLKLAGSDEETPAAPATTEPTQEGEESTYDPAYWWRMAGLGANAAGLLYNIFDPYHPQVVNAVTGYDRISPRYLGDYMTFTPYDINYATSQQDANSAASLNALRQTVAPLRNAAILANDFNSNATRGATRRQALEYNDQFRKAVTEFNRGTNQFNVQMYMDAAARNQAARQAYYESRLKQGQFNSQLDFQHKMMKDQAIGQGLTAIGDWFDALRREGVAEKGAEVFASTMPTKNKEVEEYIDMFKHYYTQSGKNRRKR